MEQPQQFSCSTLERKADYGGQALIEGIMMRSKEWIVIGLLGQDGSVRLLHKKHEPGYMKSKLARLPFVRGVFAMVDTLIEGFRALDISANAALEAELAEGKRKKQEEQPEQSEQEEQPEKTDKPISPFMMGLTMLAAIALGVGLFVWLPNWVANLSKLLLAANPSTAGYAENVIVLNIIEGTVKLFIFFLYVLVIGFMPQIRRVFAFHGAEHATINAYEAGEELTADKVLPYSTLHPRCGTNFLFLVIVVSIIAHIFLGWQGSGLVRLGLRVLMLPLILGVGYELLKLAGKYRDTLLGGLLAAPGMMFQKFTTRRPDEGMVRVAIEALDELLWVASGKTPRSEVYTSGLPIKQEEAANGHT